MYIQALKNIIISRHMKQSEVARLAHVSRAAVCKWFSSGGGLANIETNTLINLAQGLGVTPAQLLTKREDISHLSTTFLWDRLYPSMEEFLFAIVREQLPAIARLVQVQGLGSAIKIIGKKALTLFPRYKKYIKPARQRQLEILCPLYLSKK